MLSLYPVTRVGGLWAPGCGDLVVLRGILRGATNPGSRLTDEGVPIVSYQRTRSACPRVCLINYRRPCPPYCSHGELPDGNSQARNHVVRGER